MNKSVHNPGLDVHKETIAKDGGAQPRRRYGEAGTSNIELVTAKTGTGNVPVPDGFRGRCARLQPGEITQCGCNDEPSGWFNTLAKRDFLLRVDGSNSTQNRLCPFIH